MMRIGIVATAVGISLLSHGPAHADFVLEGARPADTSGASIPAAASSADLPQDAPGQAAPRFKVAQGFGNAVPLAFAVRQIVPAGVGIHYGAGIDRGALVSWRGNRPWNQALAAAIHKLHLRIVTGTNTVLITR